MIIEKLLSETFRIPDKEEWQKAAALELNGADPFQLLRWETSDGLMFLPYYDRSNIDQVTFLQKFHHVNSYQTSQAQGWYNLPSVIVNINEASANTEALDHLQNEADGIIFTLQNDNIDFNRLLKEVEWPYCTVSFIINNQFPAKDFEDYIVKHYNSVNLSGVLFWSNVSFVQPLTVDLNNLKTLGLFITQSTPVKEITSALVQAVQLIDLLQQQKLSTETIVKNVSFSIPVGENFLIEIAKLKALRLLWYQITQAYGIKSYQPENLIIYTRSEVWINDDYQPHSNMLKSTISSMSAVIGGCNAHTVFSDEKTNKMVNRIARNNSTILKEESYFSKVSDPLAGSFAIENIVHELAQAVWEKFKIEIQ